MPHGRSADALVARRLGRVANTGPMARYEIGADNAASICSCVCVDKPTMRLGPDHATHIGRREIVLSDVHAVGVRPAPRGRRDR